MHSIIPFFLAASAMLVPNVLFVLLLAKKYLKHFIKFLALKAHGLVEESDAPTAELDAAIATANSACVAIDVLSLLLNIAVGMTAIVAYFTNPDFVPVGGNLCFATHASIGVMYKPALVSFFGAAVVVCDLVYWNIIEAKPKALRRAMGHENHPDKPPVDQNCLVFGCMAMFVGDLVF